MKAKAIKAFPGVRDGQVYPAEINVGDIIDGDLAAVAIAGGLAVSADDEAAPAPSPAKAPRKPRRGK